MRLNAWEVILNLTSENLENLKILGLFQETFGGHL